MKFDCNRCGACCRRRPLLPNARLRHTYGWKQSAAPTGLHVEKYLIECEYMVVQRRFPDRTRYVRAAGAAAQYPDRPIKMIVPWAAGGDTDNIFRPFAPLLQKTIGQPVVIANVAGASGTKGDRKSVV